MQRDGEDARYAREGEPLGNRMLLWHGSRMTNFVGILSQGLRIAPPEAPVTGYMFGKGVYFADCVSKSANYCFTSREKNTGLMLLCEVALGKPRDLLQADFHAGNLPAGCHSTKGCGRIFPDPAKAVAMDDGVVIPMGPNVEKAIPGVRVAVCVHAPVLAVGSRVCGMLCLFLQSSLYYNEFIVYNVAQIKQRYLVKLKFNYKSGF